MTLRSTSLWHNRIMRIGPFQKRSHFVKGQYQTAVNPIFEVFYLEDAHGVSADFSGNPPYEF